jgi:hypothetical protein
MSAAHEASSDGRKLTLVMSVTTEDHNSDGRC